MQLVRMKFRSFIIIALFSFTLVMPFAVNAGISQSIVSIFGLFTGLGGWMFNIALDLGVLKVANTIGSQNLGSIINEMWMIVRDLVNLTLVFGLVYVGLMTILKGTHGSHMKDVLKNIIICALLVNFSLYFTKVIIDISNVTSAAIYNQLLESAPKNQSQSMTGFNYGISGAFMEAMGLSTYFNTEGINPDLIAKMTDDDGGFFYAIVGVFFMIIAAFVFFAGALLLLIRFVVLILLMIFSPILFVATTFKQSTTWRNWWIQTMTDQAVFPPVLMFMFWISYKVIFAFFQITEAGGGLLSVISDSSKAVTGDIATNNNPVLGFLMGAILMVTSLVFAKKAGAFGGDMAVKIGQMGSRWAGATTAGLAASMMRRTAGKFANTYSESDIAKERASRSLFGKAALGAARYTAASSFDVRSTKIAQNAAKAANLDLGEAKTGGYAQTLKDAKDRDKRYGDSLGKVSDDDPEVLARKAAVKQAEEALKEEREKHKKYVEGQKEAIKNATRMDNEIHDARAVLTAKQKEASNIDSSISTKADAILKETNEEKKKELKGELDELTKQRAKIQSEVESSKIILDDKVARRGDTSVEKMRDDLKEAEKKHSEHDHHREEEIQELKEQVEREKNRRQIGALVNKKEEEDTDYKKYTDAIKEHKSAIKDAAKKMAKAADDATRETHKQALLAAQKKLKENEKLQYARLAEMRKASGRSMGYAGYVGMTEYPNAVRNIYSYLAGENIEIREASVKHVRTAYKEKAPEKKEKSKKADHGDKHEEKHEEHGDGHDDAHEKGHDDHGHKH